jgi:hypothetical protein
MAAIGDSLLFQLVIALFFAGAVYGGIRNDLRRMREDLQRLERAAGKAHERIDSLAGSGRRWNDLDAE